jgi:hypothetical protein
MSVQWRDDMIYPGRGTVFKECFPEEVTFVLEIWRAERTLDFLIRRV